MEILSHVIILMDVFRPFPPNASVLHLPKINFKIINQIF